MILYHKTLLLLTLVLVASTLACSLPVDFVVDVSGPQVTPAATYPPLPSPEVDRPATPAGRSTWSPVLTATRAAPAPSPTPTATVQATATLAPSPTEPTILSHADYQVTHRVTLTNAGPGVADRVTLWVAQVRSLEPYQEVLEAQVMPSGWEPVEDEYGNQYARFQWHDVAAGGSVQVDLTYHIRVYELVYDLSLCEGEMLAEFLSAEANVEVDDPGIQALARELSGGQSNPCQTLRALYDYVGDNITYSSYEAGDRGAVWALDRGSGDCTEFSDALLALSRAAGIPARFLEGITYRERSQSDPGEIKHDWLEAHLPGIGWVPLDPTWGRFPQRRDSFFARMSPDHIVVTMGRNLSTLGGYHYFYYTWAGEEIDLSHDASWEVVPK
jgi:transglutaminase-like putative cysteine protease